MHAITEPLRLLEVQLRVSDALAHLQLRVSDAPAHLQLRVGDALAQLPSVDPESVADPFDAAVVARLL